MLFKDIIVQQDVKQRLLRSVKDNRVSHAQLFLGEPGRGGLAMAMAYAQYIHCENRGESDSCGTCKSCIKHQKLGHPDLHFSYPIALSKDVKVSTACLAEWREAVLQNPYLDINDWFGFLDAENKQPIIPAEESNEIIKKLSYTTFESEYKTMIIWMADKMHASASNKLLKILEEPPDKTLFILIVESEDKLLKTILSRTQMIKINRIDDESLQHALINRNKLAVDDAKNICFLADGNYNNACKLISQSESAQQSLQFFQDWMRAALKFDMTKVNQLMASFSELGREQQKNFLNYCLHLVRESITINYSDRSLVKTTASESQFLQKFSPFINARNCIQFTEVLNEALTHIERNGNPKIIFMDVSFKFNELLNIKQAVNA